MGRIVVVAVLVATALTLDDVADALDAREAARHQDRWRQFQEDLDSIGTNLCRIQNELTLACVCDAGARHGD